ncbi:Hypothetical predicted protein [Olea europaea subsp. europaea]|uniref:Uncharacterized protein n=1 Tax=Olea europaea subsp. europaea TaxID=158383 RepID=A0A8S0Q8J9_OLEEU|nr:Hypothetical predicted protein [Olea europaea subsp. europaea]
MKLCSNGHGLDGQICQVLQEDAEFSNGSVGLVRSPISNSVSGDSLNLGIREPVYEAMEVRSDGNVSTRKNNETTLVEVKRKGGKAFIDALLPRLNPKNMNGGPSMPFVLEKNDEKECFVPWKSIWLRRRKKKLKCFYKNISKGVNLVMVRQRGFLIQRKKWKIPLQSTLALGGLR